MLCALPFGLSAARTAYCCHINYVTMRLLRQLLPLRYDYDQLPLRSRLLTTVTPPPDATTTTTTTITTTTTTTTTHIPSQG